MEPPLNVQQQLNASGDNLQDLQGELRQVELEAQKKRLVDTFYNEVSNTYGLRPEGRIDYSQFGIDPDGKTLYWTPEDKISVASTRRGFQFLALDTLTKRYGAGGTYVLRRSLGLTDYRSGVPRGLGKEAVETLQSAEETLPKKHRAEGPLRRDQRRHWDNRRRLDRIEVHRGLANGRCVGHHAGVREAMKRMKDELANNLAKLSDADERNPKRSTWPGSAKN